MSNVIKGSVVTDKPGENMIRNSGKNDQEDIKYMINSNRMDSKEESLIIEAMK